MLFRSGIARFLFPGETVMVKQTCFYVPFLGGEMHSKVLANAQFLDSLAHTQAVFCRKGLEHAVLHDIPKRTGKSRIIGDSVVIPEPTNLAVVLVKNFQRVIIFEIITSLRFSVILAIDRPFNGHRIIFQQLFA